MTTHLRPSRLSLISFVVITLLVAACGASTPSASPPLTATPSTPAPTGSPVPSSAPSTPAPTSSPDTTGWQLVGSMAFPRLGARSVLLQDGTILVVGNRPCVAAGEPTSSERAEVFDPTTGTWSAVASLNKQRDGGALVALSGGKAMVLGGTNAQSEPYSSTKVYSPSTHAWTDGPLMERAGAIDAVALADGGVLAVGRSRAEILKAGGTTWRRTTLPPADFLVQQLHLLPSGDVLAIGERDDEQGIAATLIFDTDRSAWRTFPAPDVLRPQFVVLTDGSILAIGDDEGGSHIQRYDPASKAWGEPAQMAQGRVRAQITLLPDGRVLVAGGVPLTSTPVDGGYSVTEGPAIATSELYDPKTNTWTPGLSLHSARQGGQAMTLVDGSVVVFGGYVETPDEAPGADTGTPSTCPTPSATTERLGPSS